MSYVLRNNNFIVTEVNHVVINVVVLQDFKR